MPQLFTNNARALLASGINSSATSLTVEASKADLFPTANVGSGSLPSANNWFKAVLQDSLGNVEIVYVRTRTSGSGVFSNVLRAQEGTIAREFSAGSVVGLRMTALDIQQTINLLSNNNIFAGANTFAGPVSFTQTITGSISGNAETVTNGVYTVGSQSIGGIKTFSESNPVRGIVQIIQNPATNLQSGSQLLFAQTGVADWVIGQPAGTNAFAIWRARNATADGVQAITIDSASNFTAAGNVTAFSDIRLKRDLQAIEFALHKLKSLTGYTYTRIDTGERQTGLVAQDVQRVLPEAVQDGEYLSVAYGNLMGLVVEAVKELAHRVEMLEG